MKKMCVYTCITGDYDDLKELEIIEPEFDYYCFTNNKNIKSNTWKVIYIKNNGLNDHFLSRKLKMLGHPIINKNYDVSIWMDASIVIRKSLKQFLDKYCDLRKYSFCSFKHNKNNSIKEEAQACLALKKDSLENIKRQLNYYKRVKFPDNLGLYEMTIFVKKHNDKIVKETMKLWFEMIQKFSKRDQLSFMYCMYKTGLKVCPIELNIYDNFYFQWKYHARSVSSNLYQVFFEKKGVFIEENSIFQKYEDCLDDIKKVSIKIPSNCNSLRFDPFESKHYAVKIIDTNYSKLLKISSSNFYFENDIYYSLSEDPQLFFQADFKAKEKFELKLKIYEIYNNDYLKIVNNLNNQNRILKNEIQENNICFEKTILNNNQEYQKLEKIIKAKDQEYRKLEQNFTILSANYDRILSSVSFKITLPLRWILKRFGKNGE